MHIQRKLILPYAQEDLYSLIATVDAYPNFVPACRHVKILEHTSDFLRAELTLGYGLFKEKFISKVYLTPFDAIEAIGESGPFHHLKVVWKFQAIGPQETEVAFSLEAQFKSKLLGHMVERGMRRADLSSFTEIIEKRMREGTIPS